MKYCIITEEQEVFKAERIFLGIKRELVFTNIEEDIKHQQLEYAALIRFSDKYRTELFNDNVVFNLLNSKQWLKLIPMTDNNFNLDVPTLSLMA